MSSNWERSDILVKHQGTFTYHCWILTKAGQFATFWGTVLNWANELKLIVMQFSLGWLEGGPVRT